MLRLPRPELRRFGWCAAVFAVALVAGAAAGVIWRMWSEKPRLPVVLHVPLPQPAFTPVAQPSPTQLLSPPTRPLIGREVYATWYEVPPDSLAKRRAGAQELTAAHNRLPIGTLVRVTHLENGRSVTVRITDRGLGRGKVKLDVCKEAAIELGMLRKGIARVRMEVLPPEQIAGGTPGSQAVAAQP